ncbi:MAG: hypothetical protein ACLFM0_06155 [Spirochaetales bacterium]
MKRGLQISAIILALVLSGACASTTRTTPEEHWEYSVTERRRLGSPAVENGVVRYRGSAVPTYFSEFVVGRRRFEYIVRSDEQPFRGYRLDENWERSPEVNDSLDEPGGRERNRGWYFGDLDELRPETPADWIWVRRESLRAWVEPQRIDAFADEHELATMVRTGQAGSSAGEVRIRIGVRQTFSGQIR